MATFGYHPAAPSDIYAWYGTNNINTLVSLVHMPSGIGGSGLITSVTVYVAAKNGRGNTTARMVVWSGGGNVLAQSGDITLTPGSGTYGGQSYVTGTLSTPIRVNSGTALYIGMWRHAADSHEWTEDANANVEYSATDSSNTVPPSSESFSSGGGNPGIYATYTPAPIVTSFTPLLGGIGTVVSITGTNFTGATSVTFNNVAAISYTVNSATSITATVPVGATTGLVGVYTAAGSNSGPVNFTITGGYVRRSGVWIPGGTVGVRRSAAWTTAQFVGVRRSGAWTASG